LFPANTLKPICSDDQIARERAPIRKFDLRLLEINPRHLRVQLDRHAKSPRLVNKHAVVIRAVDVQVWCSISLFAVGKEGLGGQYFSVPVRAEHEFVGANRESFNLGEDTESFQDPRGVGWDLDTCPDLLFPCQFPWRAW
jgi:hypothetical protein